MALAARSTSCSSLLRGPTRVPVLLAVSLSVFVRHAKLRDLLEYLVSAGPRAAHLAERICQYA